MKPVDVCLCGAELAGQLPGHPPRLVIYVWNCQARLEICDGVKLCPAPKQPPPWMMEEALHQAGGAINLSGFYPPSPEILQWAEEHLEGEDWEDSEA